MIDRRAIVLGLVLVVVGFCVLSALVAGSGSNHMIISQHTCGEINWEGKPCERLSRHLMDKTLKEIP